MNQTLNLVNVMQGYIQFELIHAFLVAALNIYVMSTDD